MRFTDDSPAVLFVTVGAGERETERLATAVEETGDGDWISEPVDAAVARVRLRDSEVAALVCADPDCADPGIFETATDQSPPVPAILYAPCEEGTTAPIVAAGGRYVPRPVDGDDHDHDHDHDHGHGPLARHLDHAVGTYERALENLRERTLLDSIFEEIPVHLFVKDADARHVKVSRGFVDDPGTFVGKRDTELDVVDREHASRAVTDDFDVIENGTIITDREEYIAKLDQWNVTSKVPWRDENGDIVGLIGVSVDITERKRYEQRIERQNERLDAFASVVSHDLRNPLNVATSNLELVRETGDLERIDVVQEALDRIDEIVSDVLSLARHGDAIGELRPVSLAAIARAAWEMTDSGDARLTVETGDQTIRADESRLRELFGNLFRNAVEHSGANGVDVRIESLDGEGFAVADDGPGIPVHERDDVFEAGFTTDEDGTGLGLAIVREIVAAHGWEITVSESEAGGARFEIRGVEEA